MSIVQLNGVNIYYEVHSPSHGLQVKEPVLLLNGVMMNTSSWAKQTPTLSQSCQVILHDFRGQGQSTLINSPVTFDDHVEDLRLLLDYLNINKTHLVGTSYGSEVGMSFTLKHPERVSSLTIAAGVSESDILLKEKIKCWQRLALMATKFQTKEEFFLGTIASNFSAAYIEEHKKVLAEKGKAMAQVHDDWFVAFNYLCECFLNLDITHSLKKIKLPTLVIAGLQDELKPLKYSQIIAREISDSQLMTLDAGHALVLEKADELNQSVLDFLKLNDQ